MAVLLIVFASIHLILGLFLPLTTLTGMAVYYVQAAWGLTILLSLAAYMLSRLEVAWPLLSIAYISANVALFTEIIAVQNLSSILLILLTILLLFSASFGAVTYLIVGTSLISVTGFELIAGQGILTQPYASIGLLAPLIISAVIWRPFEKIQPKKQDDIVEKLELKLDAESSKAQYVIHAITDGVVAIDQTGAIEYLNPAASTLLKWKQQDAIGIAIDLVLKLQDSDGQALADDNHPARVVLRTNEEYCNDDIELTNTNNEKIIASVRISPTGENGGAIIMLRNVTEDSRQNRQKAEFISTASHEMRTPVASIEGYLGLALNPQTATIDEKARSYILKAHESAQHLGRLFQDLLDITRAEDGRLNNNPVVVNITDAMREYVAEFQQKAAEKQLQLTFAPDTPQSSTNTIAPVYYAKVDRDHLREILSNLIENGLKYTKAGQITVDVVGDAETVTISVSDTGIGISDEDLPHLFQKFYRIDNSDTREIGGTGLGLYLCRRLSEAMDGKLWVESTRGEGSQFYLELARIQPDQIVEQTVVPSMPAVPQDETQPTPVTPPIEAPVQPASSPQTPQPEPTTQPVDQPSR